MPVLDGGSTHANQTAALAVGAPGDRVLVTRTAHRSTLLGIILAGLVPVWLPAELDPQLGLPVGVDLARLRAALTEHPDAVALFVTEPGYVGTLSRPAGGRRPSPPRRRPGDRRPGVGRAFRLPSGVPAARTGRSAPTSDHQRTQDAGRLQPGRDRRGAHRADRRSAARPRVRRHRHDEPGGSILAAIDASRALLSDPLGAELLDRLHRLVADARDVLRSSPALDAAVVLGPEHFAPGRFDPAKLVLLLRGTRLSGNDLEAGLIAAGCPLELADRDTLVPIVTMFDDETTVSRLCDTLVAAAASVPAVAARPSAVAASWQPALPPAALDPRTAFFAVHEIVDAEHVVGRTAARSSRRTHPACPSSSRARS